MHPDGVSERLSYGVFNLCHHRSHEHPDQLVPGQPVDVEIELKAMAHTVPPGHRLRVAISTAHWPMIWPSPERATLTVHEADCSLLLPVVVDLQPPPDDPFGPPQDAVAGPVTVVRPGAERRWSTYDMNERRTEVVASRDDGVYFLDDIGTEQSFTRVRTHSILDDEPTSARATVSSRATYRRREWDVRVEADITMACTVDTFVLTARLAGYEDDRLVAERHFDREDSPVVMSDLPIAEIVDLDRYPLHRPGSTAHDALVDRCREALDHEGMCDLVGLMLPAAVERAVRELRPLVDEASFVHERVHNVWFQPRDEIPGVTCDHPSLTESVTTNRTVCADQMAHTVVLALYEWTPLRQLIAATVGVEQLHLMADPLARVNVMSYRDGEALGWHLDRAAFSITLLLQQPRGGGEFEHRPGLRDDAGVDHEAIGRVVTGTDHAVQRRVVEPGTLNVFAGRGTLHRVTPVQGPVDRIVAVFSYAETAGVALTARERVGFYGRS